MIFLLILFSLLHTTFSAVYYVIPDDDYTTNNDTYTLQHYLNNINKYFTSHTQLHFLPGQHYLNTDLIIQHVSNLSLIGNRTNEVINSVIKCTSPAGIVVVGSSNIVIANIEMEECGNDYSQLYVKSKVTSLLALNTTQLTITHFHLLTHSSQAGMAFINILQKLSLSNILAPNMTISYHHIQTSQQSVTCVTVYYLKIYVLSTSFTGMMLKLKNTLISLNFTLRYSNFTNGPVMHLFCSECFGHSVISIVGCTFSDSRGDQIIKSLAFLTPTIYLEYNKCKNKYKSNEIYLIDCKFVKFNLTSKLYAKGVVILILFSEKNYTKTPKRFHGLVFITRCTFSRIIALNCITIKSHDFYQQWYPVAVYIRSMVISHVAAVSSALSLHQTKLTIEEISVTNSITQKLIATTNGNVIFHGYNEIYSNEMTCFSTTEIYLLENMKLNFTQNDITFIVYFGIPKHPIVKCPFQYLSSNKTNLDREFLADKTLNYSVIFNSNSLFSKSSVDTKWCEWTSSSAFTQLTPSVVNERFVHHINTSQHTLKTYVCICNSSASYNCNQTTIGFAFPGQQVTINLLLVHSPYHKFTTVKIENVDGIYKSPFVCGSYAVPVQYQLGLNECKSLTYIIKHASKNWCALSLSVTPSSSSYNWLIAYSVQLRSCPPGFSLHPQGYCQCDPILSSHIPSLTTCDIDHQTIPRPANTWISAHTINNSHSYHVSLHCPFDYCLPHSSQLNLSTPDSQCQFNRSGVLCGQCQHGLSTVFGSSKCKHCSSTYLLILIPIAIVGCLVVILMFLLDATTTDGKINSFLVYTNIIGINQSLFFSTQKSILYIFISLANLDLGIELCFYDGMSDYTRMWLQLAFPMYLIFIAALLIISSRYSTTIQRLTARRALPVLATLFLLSYTKVLLTISNVLFSYTSITHLPSNHTTLVWSVDTSVPLFGVKFTILFIACLILFLILVPFNVVLIFTKKLSYFKVVTYFKPLLDAYQGPYKIKFYYWTGLQLLMRAFLFGMSALDRNINLTVSIITFMIVIWLHIKFSPFKTVHNNLMEFLSLLNLHAVFAISLVSSESYIIDISVSLTILHLACIIFMNLNTVLLSNFKCFRKIHAVLITSKDLFKFKLRKAPKHHQPIQLVNAVPEAAYNYREFQEPLIGISN